MQHRLMKRFLVLPCIIVLLLSFIISSPKVFSAGSSVSINPNQGPAGTQTTGLGSSWTPSHVIQVTWEDQSTNLGQATVDSNGNFTVSFTIPSSAPQGSHTIYFVDATGNLGYFITQTFTVTSTPSPSPSPSPTPTSTVDLQTLNIQPLQSLLAGTSPTLRANIRNNGSAASGNFNIRWIADGVIADGGHFSIPAGATDTHDYIWRNLAPGQHSITFIANFDHGVAESNYNNNQATLNFTVASPNPTPNPTVDLQTLNIQPLQSLLAGTSPTLRANIRNNGSAASGNFNIRWIADGAIADGGHSGIPAGATDTHDYIWRNITPGQHSITFIANFDHGVAESDYGNNQVTLNFTVPPTPIKSPIRDKSNDIWAGYSVEGKTYLDVKGSWKVPKTACLNNENSFSYFWVGLGGALLNSQTIEQIGTASICSNGKPEYFAWVEMLGRSAREGGGGPSLIAQNPLPVACKGVTSLDKLLALHCLLSVLPSDVLSAEVRYLGNNQFQMKLTNSNKWAYSQMEIFTGAERNTAEWIAEAPNGGLTNFNYIDFSGCLADNSPIANGPTIDKIKMEGLFPPVRALPSDLINNDTGFRISWMHS